MVFEIWVAIEYDDLEMSGEISEALNGASSDPQVWLVLLTGSDRLLLQILLGHNSILLSWYSIIFEKIT